MKKKHVWMRTLGILLTLGLLSFAVLEGVVLANAKTEIEAQPDVMVILGAQVRADGPSVLLADRLNTAVAYLLTRPDLPVVVSGGQGKDEPKAEANVMRDYLEAHGIDPARIMLECAARNTSQNLKNTKGMLEALGYDMTQTRLLVVSNEFHLARVKLLADRYGLEISVLAAPSSHAGARFTSFVRESAALVKSFLFD